MTTTPIHKLTTTAILTILINADEPPAKTTHYYLNKKLRIITEHTHPYPGICYGNSVLNISLGDELPAETHYPK